MINSSFGNALRVTGNEAYKEVLIEAAKSLATRFRPTAGVIQNWDEDRGWQGKRGWMCPVIIDNMMNLELLFKATALSGDSAYYKIAVSGGQPVQIQRKGGTFATTRSPFQAFVRSTLIT